MMNKSVKKIILLSILSLFLSLFLIQASVPVHAQIKVISGKQIAPENKASKADKPNNSGQKAQKTKKKKSAAFRAGVPLSLKSLQNFSSAYTKKGERVYFQVVKASRGVPKGSWVEAEVLNVSRKSKKHALTLTLKRGLAWSYAFPMSGQLIIPANSGQRYAAVKVAESFVAKTGKGKLDRYGALRRRVQPARKSRLKLMASVLKPVKVSTQRSLAKGKVEFLIEESKKSELALINTDKPLLISKINNAWIPEKIESRSKIRSGDKNANGKKDYLYSFDARQLSKYLKVGSSKLTLVITLKSGKKVYLDAFIVRK